MAKNTPEDRLCDAVGKFFPAIIVDHDFGIIARSAAFKENADPAHFTPNKLAEIPQTRLPITLKDGRPYQPYIIDLGKETAIIFIDQTDARTDTLTGAKNRIALHELLAKLEQSRRHPVGILMVDIDNFKIINDRYGHMAGDEVLKEVAKILSSKFRPDDLVSRFGGDEFAIVCKDLSQKLLDIKITAIINAVEQTNETREKYNLPPFSISINGIIHSPESKETLFEALDRADQKMYSIKTQKQTQSNFHDDGSGI